MKKFLALTLAGLMVLSLTACGGNTQTTAAATTAAPTTAAPTTAAPTTAAPTTEAPTTAAPTTAAPEETVISRIYVLNTVTEGLETVKDETETRYNAYWLNGYSVAQVAEDNFWFVPADDAVVDIISYVDLYNYNAADALKDNPLTWGVLKEQCISLDIPEAIASNYPSGTVCGYGVTKSLLPYQQGYIICGAEAIVLMTDDEDGYNAKYLLEDVGMIQADSYDFICADGYTEEIDAADLEQVSIFYTEAGTLDSSSIAYPTYTLNNILYIVPHDTTAESAAPAEGVAKITIFNNAKGVLDEEPTEVAGLGGTVQTGVAVETILSSISSWAETAKTTAPVIDCKEITAIGSDGYQQAESYEGFAKKYIVMSDSKGRQPYTVGGKSQNYGEAVTNVSLYVLGDVALAYVPDTYTQEAGLEVSTWLEALGITDAVAVNVVCSDGYTETVDIEDIADLFIFHNGEGVDTSSIAYPSYTLMNAYCLEIVAMR